MKFKRTQTIAVALCFVYGVVIGYISREHDSEASDQQVESKTSHTTDSQALVGTRASSEGHKQTKGAVGTADVWPDDPIERMEALLNIKGDRYEDWLKFVKSLDALELRKVVEEFSLKKYSTKNWALFDDLWREWAEKDPAFFLEKSLTFELYADEDEIPKDQFLHEKDPSNTVQFQYAALKSLAATDPQKAIQWAMDHFNGNVSSIIGRIAEDDVNRAFEVLCSLQGSIQMESALKEVTKIYASRGTEEAYNWAFEIEDEKLRAMAIANITPELAMADSKGVADRLMANPGKNSIDAIRTVMERMSKQDYKTAMDYFNGIEDGNMKSSALAGLITQDVANQDPAAVISLMDANPSAVTDDVALTLVSGAYAKDAELAISNIQRIQTPELRQEAYQTYMLCWLRDDFDKASAWVKSHGMPEDMRMGMETLIGQFHKAAKPTPN